MPSISADASSVKRSQLLAHASNLGRFSSAALALSWLPPGPLSAVASRAPASPPAASMANAAAPDSAPTFVPASSRRRTSRSYNPATCPELFEPRVALGFFSASDWFSSGLARKVGPVGTAVYFYLQSIADADGYCRVSYATIGEEIGRAEKAVGAAVRALKDAQVLRAKGKPRCAFHFTLQRTFCPQERSGNAAAQRQAPSSQLPSKRRQMVTDYRQNGGRCDVASSVQTTVKTAADASKLPPKPPSNHNDGYDYETTMGAHAPARTHEAVKPRGMAPAAVGGVDFEFSKDEIEQTVSALMQFNFSSEKSARRLSTLDAEAPERCRAWMAYAPTYSKKVGKDVGPGLITSWVTRGDKLRNFDPWPENYVREADRAAHEARVAKERAAKEKARQERAVQQDAKQVAQAKAQAEQEAEDKVLHSYFAALPDAEREAIDAVLLEDPQYGFYRGRTHQQREADHGWLRLRRNYLRATGALTEAAPAHEPEASSVVEAPFVAEAQPEPAEPETVARAESGMSSLGETAATWARGAVRREPSDARSRDVKRAEELVWKRLERDDLDIGDLDVVRWSVGADLDDTQWLALCVSVESRWKREHRVS